MMTLIIAGVIIGPLAPIAPAVPIPPFARARPVAEAHIIAYANRLINEASFSDEVLAAEACTVRNRLRTGWSVDDVLSAYFAPDGIATPDQIAVVRDVLDGRRTCPSSWYYALSQQDATYWTPHACGPVAVFESGITGKAIWIYAKGC